MAVNKITPTSSGTTAERDALTPDVGWTHFNTDTQAYEIFTGSAWLDTSTPTLPDAVFEFDSARNQSVSSSSFASPVTVNFNSTFSEPPVVVLTQSGITYQDITVQEVTTTSFTVYAATATASINWFACTAGVFNIGNSVIIQAGYSNTQIGSEGIPVPTYATGKTPAVHTTNNNTDNTGGNESRYAVSPRSVGGGGSTNLNFAGRNRSITVLAESGTTNALSFFIVTQTSTVQIGNTPTADGTQGLIGTKLFEAGTVLETTSSTPSITFATAFTSVAPVALITGETRSTAITAANAEAHLSGVSIANISPIQMASTDSRTGFNWFAVEAGFEQLTNAKRLA